MRDYIHEIIPLILAVAGGLADFLMNDEHNWKQLLIGLFLAGFCGYLVMLLCYERGVSQGMVGFCCGVSGLASRGILRIFQKGILEKIKAWLKVE